MPSHAYAVQRMREAIRLHNRMADTGTRPPLGLPSPIAIVADELCASSLSYAEIFAITREAMAAEGPPNA